MPQPIMRIPKGKPNGVLANHTDPFQSTEPEIVLLAMRVISTWAGVENAQTSAFVHIIGGHGSPAAAAFLALDSRSARTAAILAAAKKTISQEDIDRLQRLMALSSKFGRFRDRLAHWQPVSHPSFKDHIVLRNPIEFEIDALTGRVRGLFKFHRDELRLNAVANTNIAHAFLNFMRLPRHKQPPAPPTDEEMALPSPREVIDRTIDALSDVNLRERQQLVPPEEWPEWLQQSRDS